MSNTKELAIIFSNPKICYFPGDLIHGHIELNLKKSVDIQHISLVFSGFMEGCGDKLPLVNDIRLLVLPKNSEKYTTLHPKQRHSFSFEFKVPTDKRLPSCANIPKVAKITYSLTATHKKPMFKLSHTLSSAIQEINVLDKINVNLPDYRLPVKMSKDLGFINGNKSSQWCINLHKSAFTRGENIKLECQINHFPPMEKSKAIKVVLSRQVYKTSSAKVLESRVLSSTSIDLDTIDNASSQCIPIDLHVPNDTPPSVFPDSGNTLSISYAIQAELKMKGVKSAIKLKSVYKQEVAIVIGTFPIDSVPVHNNNSNPSQVSLQTLASAQTSPFPTYRKSTNDLSPIRKSNLFPPPVQHQASFSEFDNIKPLPRLEEIALKASYGSNNSFSSSSSSPTSPASLSPPLSYSMLNSSYQQEFDDYIPTTPLRRLSFSSARSSSTAASIDRSLTPLPSMKSSQVNSYNTVSYLNRKKSPRPSLLSVQTPHEIGPEDVIVKQNIGVEKPHADGDYFDSKTIEAQEDENDDTGTPGLLSRHDTMSTASSGGLAELSTTKTPILLTPIGKIN